ncbi:MAG: hypothetical protein AB8B80_15800 [Marinicellaceae bacterium]
MIKKLTSLLLITLFISAQSNAGFDVTRMTTVVDDYSGSYTTTKSGRFDDSAFLGTSLTEFSNFHLGDNEDAAGLTGTVSKEVSRSVGYLETLSDGNLSLIGAENTLDITFENLSVLFDEELTMTGEITVNEEVFNVDELPPFVASILRKIFTLTRR